MGPSLESNGMPPALGMGNHLRRASMGPSLESNGMIAAVYHHGEAWDGFNGAVARKQRNAISSMLTQRTSTRSFNGAVARKQRND